MQVKLSPEAKQALDGYRREAEDPKAVDALASELVIEGWKRVKGWRAQSRKRRAERKSRAA